MFFIPTLVGFLYELVLAIPVVGGLIVIGSSYGTIVTALVIHAIILIFRFVRGDSKVVPILALIGTLLTWIPFIGWFIHLCIAIAYFIDFFVGKRR